MKRLVLNILKRFLVIVPIALLFFVMVGRLMVVEQENARNKVIAEHTGHLRLMDFMISNVFNEYYTTLHLIQNANEVNLYFENPSERTRNEVEQFFIRMAHNRSYIRRLFLSDTEGSILIGFDAAENQRVSNDSPSPTQQPSREMAQVVRTMDPGGFYFTPLVQPEMHTEVFHGRQGVLTGIPVYRDDTHAANIGMAVSGEHILSMMDQFFIDHSSEIQFTLVNSDGSTLYSDLERRVPDDLNREMIEENIRNIIQMAKESSEGHIIQNGHNYYYVAFNPFSGNSPYYQSNDYFLAGIVSFSDEDVIAVSDSFILKNKPLRWVISLVVLLLGGFINVLTYFRKNDRELLSVSNLVSDQAHDGVVITDTMQHVTYCNRTFEVMTDLSFDEIRAGDHAIMSVSGEKFDSEQALSETRNSDTKHDSWKGFVWLGGRHHFALTYLMISSIANGQGHVAHTVGLYSNPRNLTKESSAKLLFSDESDLDHIDSLPLQLLNKRLQDREPFVIAYMRLANIDRIEAQYTLEEHYHLGAMIRKRMITTFGNDQLIFQYSPDTFVFTVPAGQASSDYGVELIHSLFEKPLILRGIQEMVLVRCGISLPSNTSIPASVMMRQAKMALAAQEHFGQDGLLRYDATVNEQLHRYYRILQDIPKAIETRAITVYYQPIVECTSGQVTGAEALVRWRHPELGDISPAEFIPIIEQHGYERMLGIYVVECVAEFMGSVGKHMRDDFSFSVNICPTELQDPDLVWHMVRALDAHGVSHHALVIELTERTLLADLQTANIVLQLLHEQDIQVAIDDFGTGFSSLSYLHELDVDVLKIDRSFIKGYPTEDDGVILKAMVGMAKELDIAVLVEGIENPEQLELIQSLGANSYQGFHFSGAIAPEDFRRLLDPS